MYILELEVKDSELDTQGIVNNSWYFVYLAHARHKYIKKLGIDFVEMAKNHQNLLLISTTIDFKNSLKSGDIFTVKSQLLSAGKIKFAFKQQIFNKNNILIVDSTNTCVCIDENNRKKPYIPDLIQVEINLNQI